MLADSLYHVTGVDKADIGKAVVGIIYPPPELRNIVDKTASFVARNGPDFETRWVCLEEIYI